VSDLSRITAEDAEEYTQALGQVTAGAWRQIALAERLGVPRALGLSTREWVDQRLGGYVRLSISERREAVAELTSGEDALPNVKVAEVLGVGEATVRRDRSPNDEPERPEPQVEHPRSTGDSPSGESGSEPEPEPPTLDQVADQIDDGSVARARLLRDFHRGCLAFRRDLLPLDAKAVGQALTDDGDRYAAGSLIDDARAWLAEIDRALRGFKVVKGGQA
jgi:hypothetical protein